MFLLVGVGHCSAWHIRVHPVGNNTAWCDHLAGDLEANSALIYMLMTDGHQTFRLFLRGEPQSKSVQMWLRMIEND